MSVNISGTFKKDDRPYNGLEAVHDQLCDPSNRLESWYVVARVRPKHAKVSMEDGGTTPTVKLDAIEVAFDTEDEKLLKDMLQRLYEGRTGAPEQPELFSHADEGDGTPDA